MTTCTPTPTRTFAFLLHTHLSPCPSSTHALPLILPWGVRGSHDQSSNFDIHFPSLTNNPHNQIIIINTKTTKNKMDLGRAGHSRGPLLLLAQRKRFVFPTLVDLCCTAIRRAVTVIDQAALLKLPDELADRLAEALTPKKTSPPSDHEPELLVVKHGKLHRFVPPPAVDLILAGTKPSTGRLGDER